MPKVSSLFPRHRRRNGGGLEILQISISVCDFYFVLCTLQEGVCLLVFELECFIVSAVVDLGFIILRSLKVKDVCETFSCSKFSCVFPDNLCNWLMSSEIFCCSFLRGVWKPRLILWWHKVLHVSLQVAAQASIEFECKFGHTSKVCFLCPWYNMHRITLDGHMAWG